MWIQYYMGCIITMIQFCCLLLSIILLARAYFPLIQTAVTLIYSDSGNTRNGCDTFNILKSCHFRYRLKPIPVDMDRRKSKGRNGFHNMMIIQLQENTPKMTTCRTRRTPLSSIDTISSSPSPFLSWTTGLP